MSTDPHSLVGIPPTQKAVFQKAYSGKSKAAALKAYCLMCCHFNRAEVTHCTVFACPLWSYRPFQRQSESSPE